MSLKSVNQNYQHQSEAQHEQTQHYLTLLTVYSAFKDLTDALTS